MNIGVFFSNTSPTSGGGFQYEINIAKLLKEKSGKNFNFFFFTNSKKTQNFLNERGIEISLIGINLLDKIIFNLNKNVYIKKYLNNFLKKLIGFENKIKKFEIDIIYFISPNADSIYINDYNFIITVWDNCHRDNLEFPEVTKNLIFESREFFLKKVLPKAVAVITESELGSNKLSRRYGVDIDRCFPISLLPSDFIKRFNNISTEEINKIKNKFNIKKDFLFYPAQLWPHKNHVYILKSLKILKEEKNTDVDFYFCGENKGNLNHIISEAKKLKIDSNVKYLGFVEDKDLVALYKNALALVMPSYFGTVNIPPLDAFKLSCPVCYKCFDPNDKLMNEAIWKIDLDDPETLVNSIIEIKNNPNLKEIKIKNGYRYLSTINENKVWGKIERILKNYQIKKNCWSEKDYR